MHELLRRLRSPTPAFWRKVRTRGALAIATLTSLLALDFDPTTKKVLLWAILFLSGLVAAAQLTCDDPTPPADSSPSTPA